MFELDKAEYEYQGQTKATILQKKSKVDTAYNVKASENPNPRF